MNRPPGRLACVCCSSSLLISSSSSDDSSDESESSALFRKRDMAGFAAGAACFGPSSSLDMSSSSSEEELSESESPAARKNRDIVLSWFLVDDKQRYAGGKVVEDDEGCVWCNGCCTVHSQAKN